MVVRILLTIPALEGASCATRVLTKARHLRCQDALGRCADPGPGAPGDNNTARTQQGFHIEDPSLTERAMTSAMKMQGCDPAVPPRGTATKSPSAQSRSSPSHTVAFLSVGSVSGTPQGSATYLLDPVSNAVGEPQSLGPVRCLLLFRDLLLLHETVHGMRFSGLAMLNLQPRTEAWAWGCESTEMDRDVKGGQKLQLTTGQAQVHA